VRSLWLLPLSQLYAGARVSPADEVHVYGGICGDRGMGRDGRLLAPDILIVEAAVTTSRTERAVDLAAKAIRRRCVEIDTTEGLSAVIVTINFDRRTRQPVDALCQVHTREVAEPEGTR
jgi:hypothetical protein